MYCTSCGKTVGSDISYCPHCGGAQPGIRPNRRAYRPRRGRQVAGVCLGLAQYLEIDVTIVRVVWLMVAILGGGGFLAYLIAWMVMPTEEDLPVLYPATSSGASQRS